MIVSGCEFEPKIQAEIGMSGKVPSGFISDDYAAASSNAQTTIHIGSTGTADDDCNVTIHGTLNGKPSTHTVTTSIKITAAAGSAVSVDCEDPAIFEFPNDVSGFKAVAFQGKLTIPLSTRSQLDTIPLAGGGKLVAETNDQIVVTKFSPKVAPGVPYRIKLKFAPPKVGPETIKALYAAEVTCPSSSPVYLPIIPKVSSIAQAPAYTIGKTQSLIGFGIYPMFAKIPSQQSVSVHC
jgi:hypothetical protein